MIQTALESDAAGIARVHINTWRTTYAGILPDELLAGLSYERRSEMWRRAARPRRGPGFLLVAKHESGEIIGFAEVAQERSGKHAYAAEVYALYVLKHVQGQGIGRALMREAAVRLREGGLDSVMLWVLAENPSRGFYEALGGQQIDTQDIEIGGENYPEVAYGWSDLGSLASG